MKLIKLTKEEHEEIFNLFKMNFLKIDTYTMDRYSYDMWLDMAIVKNAYDAFPINEVCHQELFHKENECYYKSISFITEG
jgi:hypothetical protein